MKRSRRIDRTARRGFRPYWMLALRSSGVALLVLLTSMDGCRPVVDPTPFSALLEPSFGPPVGSAKALLFSDDAGSTLVVTGTYQNLGASAMLAVLEASGSPFCSLDHEGGSQGRFEGRCDLDAAERGALLGGDVLIRLRDTTPRDFTGYLIGD